MTKLRHNHVQKLLTKGVLYTILKFINATIPLTLRYPHHKNVQCKFVRTFVNTNLLMFAAKKFLFCHEFKTREFGYEKVSYQFLLPGGTTGTGLVFIQVPKS